jgi:hypothetical protein
MARKPRLRTLSIFLLREEIGSWDDALRDGEGVSRHETRKAVDVDGLLVVGSPNRKPPWWRDYVSPYVLRSGELESTCQCIDRSAVFLRGGRPAALPWRLAKVAIF